MCRGIYRIYLAGHAQGTHVQGVQWGVQGVMTGRAQGVGCARYAMGARGLRAVQWCVWPRTAKAPAPYFALLQPSYTTAEGSRDTFSPAPALPASLPHLLMLCFPPSPATPLDKWGLSPG